MSEAAATTPTAETFLEQRASLKDHISALQDQVKALDEEIKAELGDGNHQLGRWSVTIGTKEVSRLDTTALKKALPDIAREYTKTKTEALYQVRELKA